MANWTVTAKWTKQPNGLAWNVLATFESDDARKYSNVPFNGILSKDNARRTFENQIAQYEVANFAPDDGAFDMSKPAPPTPPSPTEKELAQRDYVQKRNALDTAQRDFDLKLADQAAFDKALQAAKDAKAALETASADVAVASGG